MKLPTIVINDVTFTGVNDDTLAAIAKDLLGKHTDVIVGVQMSPLGKKLGYKRLKFEFPPLATKEAKENGILENLYGLAYGFTIHTELRKVVTKELSEVKLLTKLKKLVKEMVGHHGLIVHKDLIVLTCGEDSITIQGVLPKKIKGGVVDGLPPIYTVSGLAVKNTLKKLKKLGVDKGCKTFYMDSNDLTFIRS